MQKTCWKQLYGTHLHLFLSFTQATVSSCPLTSSLLHPHPAVCLSILSVPHHQSLSENLLVFASCFLNCHRVYWDPAKAPPFLPVCRRLIKLSRSVIRHSERKREGGFGACCGWGGHGHSSDQAHSDLTGLTKGRVSVFLDLKTKRMINNI